MYQYKAFLLLRVNPLPLPLRTRTHLTLPPTLGLCWGISIFRLLHLYHTHPQHTFGFLPNLLQGSVALSQPLQTIHIAFSILPQTRLPSPYSVKGAARSVSSPPGFTVHRRKPVLTFLQSITLRRWSVRTSNNNFSNPISFSRLDTVATGRVSS